MPSSVLLPKVWGKRQGYVFLPYRRGDGSWCEGDAIPAASIGISVDLPALTDQYFCPLVFDRPKRLALHALPTPWLWSDLDAVDPAKTVLRPSVAWLTTPPYFGKGGHYQALWLLDTPIEASEAAALSRRIAYAEGADHSGWDVTQVLRVPGTMNGKRDPATTVELLWAKRIVYARAAIERHYPMVPLPSCAPASDWPNLDAGVVAATLSDLPFGIRYHLQRNTLGADRSIELLRLASMLLRFGVEPGMAAHILAGSSWNKYRGRADESTRLMATVARAQA